MVRNLSKKEEYRKRYEYLPGIGTVTVLCLLTEIDDMSWFVNERDFASYLGLIPTSYSSGEKTLEEISI